VYITLIDGQGRLIQETESRLRGAGLSHHQRCKKKHYAVRRNPHSMSTNPGSAMALARALAVLQEGDTMIVTRLDRLARSTRDLLNTLDTIARKGAGFRSLADAWADTTTPHGRLMLTVLGGLAEFEREVIRARTGEGRARAKAKGVHMGRPRKLDAHQRREALKRREAGESLTDIARTYGVAHTTIGRL
jgi:DNA invertase Pin-like site-specific DNA recombinase